MSDEACLKCPNCNTTTLGVKTTRQAAPVFCPKCLSNGVNSVMLESVDEKPVNLGGGLFKKNKENLNEEKQILNETN